MSEHARSEHATFLVRGNGNRLSLRGLELEFQVRGDRTAEQLSLASGILGPHRLVPPHVHDELDEYAYLLEGELGARVGDEEVEVRPGDWLLKPRGIPHAFWNPADRPARTLDVVVPSGFESFFEELAEAIATGDPQQVRARREKLGEQHRMRWLGEWVPELRSRYGLTLIGE